jgi:undecaprenyl-diphosphatase
MTVIEAIILGLIQGLTEFIPVSSSGHLVIAQQLFSGASEHLFLEFVNIGTLLALVVYFWQRIASITRDIVVNKNSVLLRNIIITSVPAGLVGYVLADFIGSSPFFASMIVVMITLALVGAVMILLEKLPMASGVTDGSRLTPLRALIIGGAQMLALVPGVSRSGSTIITGRLIGLKPAAAAEYSFMASLPIMVGVTVKLLIDPEARQYLAEYLPILVASNIFAFISGLLAVGFLMRFLATHSLVVFGWYRVGLAAIIGLILLLQ